MNNKTHPLRGITDQRVSVCMPYRNRLKEFQVTAQGLLAQRPDEIVIVDDASNDGSEEWLPHGFALTCKRAGIDFIYKRLVDTGYKRYPLEAFNSCMSLATGDILIQQSPEVAHLNHVIAGLVIALAWPDDNDESRNEHTAFARVLDAPLLWVASLPPFGAYKRTAGLKGLDGLSWDERQGIIKQHTLPVLTEQSRFPVQAGQIRLYTGQERPMPFFFCGAIYKSLWVEMNGYDLTGDYNREWGADAEFAKRLLHRGSRIHGLGSCIACHIQHGRS